MAISSEGEYQLRTCDFDRWGNLQPAAVLDIFQDIAGVNAEATGIGVAAMRERGIFWVLARVKYEVVRSPSVHEAVIARTWPLAPRGGRFQREYHLRGLDGTVCVKASSDWVLVDLAERRIVPATDVFDADAEFATETSFEGRVRKLPGFDEPDGETTVVCRFTDIDLNGHVNNAKYASFALDAVGLERGESIRTLQIDYRGEIVEGEAVRVQTRRAGDTIDVRGVDDGGGVRFACRMELA